MEDQQARREPGGAMDGGASAARVTKGSTGGRSRHQSGESNAKYIARIRETAAKAAKAATGKTSKKGGGRAGSAAGGDGDDSSDATEVSALILPCDAPGEDGGRSDALRKDQGKKPRRMGRTRVPTTEAAVDAVCGEEVEEEEDDDEVEEEAVDEPEEEQEVVDVIVQVEPEAAPPPSGKKGKKAASANGARVVTHIDL